MSSNTSCTIYVDTLIIFCLDDISDKQAPAVIILLEKDLATAYSDVRGKNGQFNI